MRYIILNGVICDADTGRKLEEEEITYWINHLTGRIEKLENRLKEKDELLKKTLEVNSNLTKRLLESEDGKG